MRYSFFIWFHCLSDSGNNLLWFFFPFSLIVVEQIYTSILGFLYYDVRNYGEFCFPLFLVIVETNSHHKVGMLLCYESISIAKSFGSL